MKKSLLRRSFRIWRSLHAAKVSPLRVGVVYGGIAAVGVCAAAIIYAPTVVLIFAALAVGYVLSLAGVYGYRHMVDRKQHVVDHLTSAPAPIMSLV